MQESRQSLILKLLLFKWHVHKCPLANSKNSANFNERVSKFDFKLITEFQIDYSCSRFNLTRLLSTSVWDRAYSALLAWHHSTAPVCVHPTVIPDPAAVYYKVVTTNCKFSAYKKYYEHQQQITKRGFTRTLQSRHRPTLRSLNEKFTTSQSIETKQSHQKTHHHAQHKLQPLTDTTSN